MSNQEAAKLLRAHIHHIEMNPIEEEIRRHETSIRWLQIISIINSITCLILAITRMLR